MLNDVVPNEGVLIPAKTFLEAIAKSNPSWLCARVQTYWKQDPEMVEEFGAPPMSALESPKEALKALYKVLKKHGDGDWSNDLLPDLCNRLLIRRELGWGYIRRDGTWALSPRLDIEYAYPEELVDKTFAIAERVESKLGVLNTSGYWCIEPRYDLVLHQFADEFAVKSGQHWGIVNSSGETLITIAWDHFWHIGSGSYLVHSGEQYQLIRAADGRVIELTGATEIGVDPKFGMIPFKNSGWGIIAMDGSWVVRAEHDDVWIWSKERFLVQAQGKWRLIDASGDQVTDAVWSEIDKWDGVYFRTKNAGRVLLASNDRGWGIIDDCGNWRVGPQFSEISHLNGEFHYLFRVVDSGNCGVINDKGDWIVRGLEELGDVTSEGLESEVELAKFNGKWGLLGPQGDWQIVPEFDELQASAGNAFAAKVGECWGFVDQNGNWMVRPVFEEVGEQLPYLGSHVKLASRWGFVNCYNGQWIVPPIYHDANDVPRDPLIVAMNSFKSDAWRRNFAHKPELNSRPIQFADETPLSQLPPIAEVCVFGTKEQNENGTEFDFYECFEPEDGVPYLRFDTESCYDSVLNNEGAALKGLVPDANISPNKWMHVTP